MAARRASRGVVRAPLVRPSLARPSRTATRAVTPAAAVRVWRLALSCAHVTARHARVCLAVCALGYVRNNNNLCVATSSATDASCAVVTSATTLMSNNHCNSACPTSHVNDLSGCQACCNGSPCTSCQTGCGYCDGCPAGYALVFGGNTVTCVQGCVGRAWRARGWLPWALELRRVACSVCPANCVKCTSVGACLLCVSGYGLSGGACAQVAAPLPAAFYTLAYTPMVSGKYDLFVDLRIAEGLYGTYFSQVRGCYWVYLCV